MQLTQEAFSSILDLMFDDSFVEELETIYNDSAEERSYIEYILPYKFLYYNDYVRVLMDVHVNVPYVNDRSNFIYELDFDYEGEPL